MHWIMFYGSAAVGWNDLFGNVASDADEMHVLTAIDAKRDAA